jgi:hypothetical protein
LQQVNEKITKYCQSIVAGDETQEETFMEEAAMTSHTNNNVSSGIEEIERQIAGLEKERRAKEIRIKECQMVEERLASKV